MIDQGTLDAARLRGDAAADRVVTELGGNPWTAVEALRSSRQRETVAALLPLALERFVDEEGRLPAWFARTRVLSAQRWANAHLFHLTAALFHAALPSTYAAAKGARVLHATGRLREDIDRRVNETARFILDVLALGAFENDARAVRSILEVRLVHAAVRASPAARDAAPGEVPLNQEDLLGALLAFSVIVVRGVRRLGAQVSAHEADDYFHLWRVTGRLMGIEEALLPATFAEAERAADLIAKRHFRASEHGRSLASVLEQRIGDHVLFPGLTRHLIRYMAGDRVADLLAIPPAQGFRRLLAELSSFLSLDDFPLDGVVRELATVAGQPLLRSVVFVKLERT